MITDIANSCVKYLFSGFYNSVGGKGWGIYERKVIIDNSSVISWSHIDQWGGEFYSTLFLQGKSLHFKFRFPSKGAV